jgi:hypothetical protein
MAQVIHIPRLNDSRADFEQLFGIWSRVNDDFADVRFDFSQCGFLRPNAVAFLGGLARLIGSRRGTVVFEWDTLQDKAVMMNLCQNGFAGKFGHPSPGWTGNSIPYREDTFQDMNGIMDYLTDFWLGRGWVNVSQELRDTIVGHVWEIYANAFEHAGSKIGVFSCGQHFPLKNELTLSVIDFGHGIAANVRNFLSSDPRAEHLTAAACMQWAFKDGNTTRPDIRRGLGLKLLKEFMCANRGKLEVYSNEGYVLMDKDGEQFENRSSSFDGTVVHITLRCDEKDYKLAHESYEAAPYQ